MYAIAPFDCGYHGAENDRHDWRASLYLGVPVGPKLQVRRDRVRRRAVICLCNPVTILSCLREAAFTFGRGRFQTAEIADRYIP